jgi:heptosyltransferase-3
MSSSAATEGELPEPREILYINVSRIGDTLLVTPAVRAVAARWPAARITLLAHPKREEVVAQPALRASHQRSIEKAAGANFMGRIWNPFAGKAFDLAFVCNFDAPLIEYALRVAHRVVAFRQSDDALNRRLYRAVEHPALQTTHAVDIQLLLPAARRHRQPRWKGAQHIAVTGCGSALGRRTSLGAMHAALTPSTDRPAGGKFPDQGLPRLATRTFQCAVPAHPGDAGRTTHFLIFGGDLENGPHRSAGQRTGQGQRHLCAGRLTLRETAALMNRIDLYVGVDTGPTHLMGAHAPADGGALPRLFAEPGVGAARPSLPLGHRPSAGRSLAHLKPTWPRSAVDRVWDAVHQALAEHPLQ